MSEKKKGGFWADFKAFITRGNVVDMAVGVVIGGAFGKIVTGLVNYIINPCVSLLTDGTDLDNIKTVLRKGVEATETTEAVPEVAILWGTWIQTILDFLLVAFCIFLVLRVLMRAKNRLEAKKIAEADAAAAAAKAAEEAVAARQTAVEDAILRQEKLLAELVETVKSK
jgi:large conductance mechanosensitive channel